MAQNAQSVSVVVNRTGSMDDAISVDYATVSGTANPGSDFSSESGVLTWAENDSSPKTVTIPISDATPFTGSKTFQVTLSQPSPHVQIINPGSITVTISGNATADTGSVSFATSAYQVAQSGGSVIVTVNRGGDSTGSASVAYATTNGTAVAGTDFTAAGGTLSWADGDAAPKTIAVAVSNATPFTGDKAFGIALSDPGTGTVLGNPDSTTVTIVGDAVQLIARMEMAAPSKSVAQNAGSVPITVMRVGGSTGNVSVAYGTQNGSAAAGTDFSAASGTLTWADGDMTSRTLTVAILDKTPFSGNKTFTLSLSNPSQGAAIGNPGSITVTIAGNAAPPVGSVELSSASYSVVQGAVGATVMVNRSGGSTGAVGIHYQTVAGTAVAGHDFTSSSGTLNWANGDSTPKSFSVPISDSTPFAGTKSFSVALSQPSGGATLGAPVTAAVTIKGNGVSTVGSLQLSASKYTVIQGVGSATFAVNRTGGSSGAVSVVFATSNGTAIAGTNYTASSGTLTWASGDAAVKTFAVPIINATPLTGTMAFTLTLSNPVGGATLSTPSSAIVNITGDAPAAVGALQLSSASNSVAQSAGTLTITVNRTGGSSGTASVAYATAGGTAVSGTDFTASSGTLSWASGDASSKTFSVPISNATPFTGTKSFSVTLSAASGATLGSPTSDTVTITGSGAVTSNGGAAPSAPATLVMTNQSQNSISLSWSAAAPGSAPISHYKIYRNGAAYATATGTTYTDGAASNANSPVNNAGPTLTVANTVYAYAVSAVDTAGNEGPQQANATFWVYYNGVYNWLGDYSYPSPGGISINYADTSGAPEEGPADIEVNSSTTAAGFLPYSGKTTTQWDMEGGSFNYISMDLKPTLAGQDWEMYLVSRLPPGDVTPWAFATLSHYGPAPVVGKWATYKIPLSVFAIGTSQFTGSISGTTLTVTSVNSGVGLEAGGFVTGPGIPSGTYIIGNSSTSGGPGTYQVQGPGINGSTQVASENMVEQHTGIYKFGLVDRNASSPGTNHYYIDNIKFTVD